MVLHPPILSLCRSCLFRRIFPIRTLLHRRSIPISLPSTYQSRSLSAQTRDERGPPRKKQDIRREGGGRESSQFPLIENKNETLPKWTVTVGLEIHAQLNTKRKLFSDARTSYNAPPNTLIAPLDASLPGTQPVFNPAVLLPALRAALALNCTPAPESRFDRKHYFYWDQPAGYQITQFYSPLALDGWLVMFEHDGVPQLKGMGGTEDDGIRIGIQQIQLEQDTGKTLMSPPNSLIDLNRVGSPLIEIITHPFDCPDTLFPALVMKKIQASLKAVDACVIGMEWGGLRADVNVSVRLTEGPGEFGQRCEIKNVSSIKAVQAAVISESNRQIAILEAGGCIEGETRGWDAEKGITRRLRGKEGEVDYRFMPEPDLPPIHISQDLMLRVQQFLPLVPDKMLAQLTAEPYNLPVKDAQTLILWNEAYTATESGVIDYYKKVVRRVTGGLMNDKYPQSVVNATKSKGGSQELLLSDEKKRLVLPTDGGKVVGKWVVHELGGHLAKRNLSWKENPIDVTRMADLVLYVMTKRITGPTAKTLLADLCSTTPIDPRPIGKIIKDSDLEIAHVPDEEIIALAEQIMSKDPKSLEVFEQLKDPKLTSKRRKGFLSYFVGGIMRQYKGRVQAERVEQAVIKVVENETKR